MLDLHNHNYAIVSLPIEHFTTPKRLMNMLQQVYMAEKRCMYQRQNI